MADGKVPLHGEGGDGQDGCVSGHLRRQSAQDAERFAERVRILVPQLVQLLGQAWKKDMTALYDW